jgi:hypothetical protein
MPEIERTRLREREPAQLDSYERQVRYLMELRDRAFNGKVVIHPEEVPWEPTRQGKLQTFICREADTGSVLNDWVVFIHDIKTHSGKHRHQGGLVIYVLEGEGYTEVDGARVEWEAGDLLLLPIKPGAVEHKHFNRRPGENCKWMAFIFRPYNDAIGYFLEQKETSPDYR